MAFYFGCHVLLQRRQANLLAEQVNAVRLKKRPLELRPAFFDDDDCAEDLMLILYRLYSVRDETKVSGNSVTLVDGHAQQLYASAAKLLLRIGVLKQQPR